MRLTIISMTEKYPSDEGRVVTALLGFRCASWSSSSVKAVPSTSWTLTSSTLDASGAAEKLIFAMRRFISALEQGNSLLDPLVSTAVQCSRAPYNQLKYRKMLRES